MIWNGLANVNATIAQVSPLTVELYKLTQPAGAPDGSDQDGEEDKNSVCLRFSTLLDPNFYELWDNQKKTKILRNPRKISKNPESIIRTP